MCEHAQVSSQKIMSDEQMAWAAHLLARSVEGVGEPGKPPAQPLASRMSSECDYV
jgi:hypothetical protein